MASSTALLVGLLVAPLIFILSAWLTRANRRRTLSALAGGMVYGVINVAWDQVALAAGWWSYPGYALQGRLPLIYYAIAGVVYAAFALFGWRLARGYRRKGLLIFMLFWSLWGLIHDAGGSAVFAGSQLMVFSPGPVPLIANLLLYLTGMSAALAVIRWLGGPYKLDRLKKYIAEG